MWLRLKGVWGSLWSFLTNMDQQAMRAVWVTLALFACVGVVFVIGKTDIGHDLTHGLEAWMAHYAKSPWAIFIVIAVFTVSAFIAAPQFVLIAACVVAFGPWLGFGYSWVATIVSAAVTFYAGRLIGADTLAKIEGKRMQRLSEYIGRNSFTASFIVRNVPSAPFIIVNMAFGVSKARFSGFILGCALGSIPKTALVALFGSSFTQLSNGGDPKGALLIGGIGILWLGLMMFARTLIEKWRQNAKD